MLGVIRWLNNKSGCNTKAANNLCLRLLVYNRNRYGFIFDLVLQVELLQLSSIVDLDLD